MWPFSCLPFLHSHLRFRPGPCSSQSSAQPAQGLSFLCSPTLAHAAAKLRPLAALPAPLLAPLALPPHRGSCQNEDGFLSRERHVGVCLNQGLHSCQRQPRETRPGRTGRGLRLRGRCLPTGPLLLPGRPASSSHSRHPGSEQAARGRRLCARMRRRRLSPRAGRPRPLWARVPALLAAARFLEIPASRDQVRCVRVCSVPLPPRHRWL